MITRSIACGALAAAVLAADIRTTAQKPLPPGWASEHPMPAPRLFAEGVLSTPDDEMDAGFAPDGKTVYFTKDHIGQRLGVIVASHFDGRAWSPPEVVSFSGRYTDYDPDRDLHVHT